MMASYQDKNEAHGDDADNFHLSDSLLFLADKIVGK
jgi:hypothetical protein